MAKASASLSNTTSEPQVAARREACAANEPCSHIIWKVDLRKTLRYRVMNNPHIMRVPELGTYCGGVE
jgi:hypothetical protein